MDDIPICPDWWPKMLWKIHFPPPRPGPGPGPVNYPPAIDHMMAALAMHSLSYMFLDKTAAEGVRTLTEATLADTAKSLSKLHENAVAVGPRKALKEPTDEEIDAMASFSSSGSECGSLCRSKWSTVEELDGATGHHKQELLARLRAINRRMKELNCPLCLPE